MTEKPLNSDDFLSGDYEPMPTLVEAARRMFEDGDLPNIRRARAATDPALETAMRILTNAANTRSRKLILLSGCILQQKDIEEQNLIFNLIKMLG